MKKLTLSLLVSSLAIIGCGGGGGSSTGPSSTGYAFSTFQLEGTNGELENLQRTNYKVSDGVLYAQTPIALKGRASQNYTTSYYGNSDFFIRSRSVQTNQGQALFFISNISNTGETLTPYNSNNSKALTSDYTYTVVSLAGKKNADVLRNVLDFIPNSSNLVWPANAVCRYTSSINEKTVGSDTGYFYFDETSKTTFTTLNDWEANIKSQTNVNIDDSKTINGNYGGNNANIPFRGLVDSTAKKPYIGSLYTNNVYTTSLYKEGVTNFPFTQKTYCDEYNQVAADFIQAQVKK